MVDYEISDSFVDGLVSIIIPTHNRGDIICETIDSVFKQSYSAIELIIVDDNSSDNAEELIKKKRIAHPLFDFQYLKSKKLGGCAARNLGLSVSKGEYIQFFDDDDIMKPNFIKNKVVVLQRDLKYDFVTCNFEYFKGNIENIVGEKRVDNIIHSIESHLLKSAFPAPAFMCRRNCISKIGFWNENISKFQDICYFHRLFLCNLRGDFMDSNLFYVRLHDSNISSNKSKMFYQSMIDAFESVKAEWAYERKMTKKLLDVIYLLKVIVLLQAFKRGYYIWCLTNLVHLSMRDIKQSYRFLKLVSLKMVRKINNSNITIYDILILGR